MTANDAIPQRLYLLRLQSTVIQLPGGPYGLVVSYLVEMSDGTHVLIDSGVPEGYQPPGGTSAHTAEKTVLTELAALGFRPSDIDILICTHFDVDHAGCHDAFSTAEVVVQRAHYEAARRGHPRYEAARAHWDHPGLRYRLVTGDTELFRGLRLIETSGHAPGHQSVLIHLPKTGPVLLASDAVPLARLFTPDRNAWPLDDNEEQLRASTRKLLDLVEREQVGLVVFGHDPAQWETLRRAPAYYE